MKIKKLVTFAISLSMILTLSVSYCFADSIESSVNTNSEKMVEHEIDSKQLLDEAISEANKDNKITRYEGQNILDDMEPDILTEYIKEVDDAAADYFENAEPVEKKYDAENDKSTITYRVDIDPLSSVELTLTDCEESSIVDMVGKNIKNLFVDECYAATNGDTLWKNYGKRYYTAKYTRSIGPGAATICTENHYTISKSKITERPAVTWLHSMSSITGDISSSGYSYYAAATKAGATTGIRARVTFKYRASGAAISTTSYYTLYENLKIKFVKDNPAKKQMKVKYTWNKTDI